MSDFEPTHESIGGVKAYVTREGSGFWAQLDGQRLPGVGLERAELAALFEPIRPPPMVTIELTEAREMLSLLQTQGMTWDKLRAAIALAEKETPDA